MPTQEVIFELDQDMHVESSPITCPKRTLLFFVKFTLQESTRLILSHQDHDDDNHEEEDEEEEAIVHDFPADDLALTDSSMVALDPDDIHSWEGLRRKLQSLCLELSSKIIQDRVLRFLMTYVNNIIKEHFCPSDRTRAGPKNVGRRVYICVPIHRVRVYRDRVHNNQVKPTPADDMAIKSLKRVRVDQEVMRNEKCLVCLEELANEEEVTCLPCDHAFHGSCIVKWLNTSRVCPLCRFELPASKQPRLHY